MKTITLNATARVIEIVTPGFRKRATEAWAQAQKHNAEQIRELTSIRGKLMLAPQQNPQQHQQVIAKLHQLEQVEEAVKQQATALEQIRNGAEVVVGEQAVTVEVEVGERVETLLGSLALIVEDGVLIEIRTTAPQLETQVPLGPDGVPVKLHLVGEE